MFKYLTKKYGKYFFLRLFLYPMTALFIFPVISLINYSNLAIWQFKKNKGTFIHFSSGWSLISLWYWVRADALKKLNKIKKIDFLGEGIEKSDLWNYSPIAMNLFKYGVNSIIFSTLILQISLIYISIKLNNQSFIHLIMLIFFSSTVWAIYLRQNYQIISWTLLPVTFYFILTSQLLPLAICFLLLSISSISAFVIGLFYYFIYSVFYFSPTNFLLVISPSSLFYIINIVFGLYQKNQKVNIPSIISDLKLIGATKSKVKYKRGDVGIFKMKYIEFYILFVTLLSFPLFIKYSHLPIFLLSTVIFLLLNKIIRVLDIESIIVMVYTSSIIELSLVTDINVLLVCLVFILLNPPPIIIGFPHYVHSFDRIPIVKPFDIAPLMKVCESFLSKVENNKNVLIAFSNPKNKYEKMFDGYGYHFLNLLHYVLFRKNTLLVPDWFYVVSNNYEEADDLWGRDLNSIIKNSKKINADYVIHISDELNSNNKIQKNNLMLINFWDTSLNEAEFKGVSFRYGLPKLSLFQITK